MAAATPPTPVREPLPAPPTVGETVPARVLCPRCGHPIPQSAEGRCPTCAAPVASNETVPAAMATPLPAPDPRDDEGKPFGPYRLLEELGHGGMGRVWKAWDTRLKRIVALKQILSQGAADATQIERFMREARLAAKLRHPHIVAVHDVGIVEGQYYFVCDFIEGTTLSSRIEQGVPQRQAASWVRTVAEALAYAHDQSVIHRDVKPGNILIDASDRPFVTDFGLAKDVELGSGSSPSGPALTLSGCIVGTPQYMSPEQASGRPEAIGPASDQFALGVVLYELLTRRAPFVGASLRDILNAVTEQDPLPPSRVNPKVHRDLETICLKALSKAPSHRYATLSDMAADLGRYLAGEPIHARPESLFESVSRRIAKHRRIVLPAAIAAAVVLLVGASWLVKRVQDRRSAEANLGLARTSLARGLAQDARDAYARVLAIDRGNAEARAGYDEAARRLHDAAESADAERRRAVAEKEEAGELLRKSGLVQDVLARWLPLTPTVEGMETAYFTIDEPAHVAKRNAEAWKSVQAFLDATPDDITSRATALSFAGWARRLAGDQEGGLAMLRQAQSLDPDLPYGLLMEAMVDVDIWSYSVRFRTSVLQDSEMRFELAVEPSPEANRLREEIVALLDRAAGSRVWGRGMAQDFRAVIDAVRLIQAGNLVDAESALTRLIDAPSLRMLRTGLIELRAESRYYQRRFREAEEDDLRALEVRKENPIDYLRLGLYRNARGCEEQAAGADPGATFQSALEAIEEAVRIAPGLAEAWNARGAIRLRLGAEKGAIADFQKAIECAPNKVEAYANLATVLLEKGDARDAIDLLDKAISIDPKLASAYEQRGAAKKLARDLAGAEEDYGRAIDLDPKSWQARTARAYVRGSQGNAQGAIEDLDAALALHPKNALALANRGTMKLMTGDLAGGRTDLDASLDLEPDNPTTLYMRAQAREADDPGGARADLDAALRAAPADWPHRAAAEKLRDVLPR